MYRFVFLSLAISSLICHIHHSLARLTGNIAVAAVTKASDVDYELILFCCRPLRNTEGDLRSELCGHVVLGVRKPRRWRVGPLVIITPQPIIQSVNRGMAKKIDARRDKESCWDTKHERQDRDPQG